MPNWIRYIVASFALAGGTAPALSAQGWIESDAGGSSGFGVVRLRTAVHAEVRGRIAEVTVEEWFLNQGGQLGEGDYIYPLPGEAAFGDFSLFQGDVELRGETMDATTARSIYEEIVRRKRDPALIELVGHGLLRARVFPIGPGETRKITLRYTQVLARAGDALQFRYASGSRNVGVRPTRGEGQLRPPRSDGAPLSFEIVAADDAVFAEPFSPTHPIRTERRNGRLSIKPDSDLNGDFSLFLPLARNEIGIAVATHRPSATEAGYFMMTVSPGTANGVVLPRDVTAVVDVSGSMSGMKLEQAKAALRQLLDSLRPTDRFRLIAFSSRVASHSADWVDVTPRGLRDARQWIDRLAASGGTNIAGALEEAFATTNVEGRLPIALFVTDGLPSVGESDPDRIAASIASSRGGTRVFAFGLGYDVNTYLLDRLTTEGRGATHYVEPGENVETSVGALVTKIGHPVLADLHIDRVPVEISEIYPVELPDLYAGEEMIVFGRYEPGGSENEGDVTVWGRRSGRSERFGTTADFPVHDLSNEFIPRLWASRKLGFLTTTMRLEGHTPDLERVARETALRYGLLSEYTSYLVQEPQMVATRRQDANSAPVAQMDQIVVTGASRPAAAGAAVGREAVQKAKKEQENRDVRSASELFELSNAPFDDETAMRTVAGRVFVREDTAWVDRLHSSEKQIVAIEAYSEAYFTLLRKAPELEPWLSSFDHVVLAGARISIQIGPEGADHLIGSDLARILKDFRG